MDHKLATLEALEICITVIGRELEESCDARVAENIRKVMNNIQWKIDEHPAGNGFHEHYQRLHKKLDELAYSIDRGGK